MPQSFNSNSFAPFLETINRLDSKSTSNAADRASILQKLAATLGHSIDIPSLLSASELSVDTFASTLKDLEAMGLLVTRTENGRQWAVLSATGAQAARVGFR